MSELGRPYHVELPKHFREIISGSCPTDVENVPEHQQRAVAGSIADARRELEVLIRFAVKVGLKLSEHREGMSSELHGLCKEYPIFARTLQPLLDHLNGAE